MRSRLKKYVAVVMALLLCIGLWFGHSQTVKAEIPVTGALNVNIMEQSEDGAMNQISKTEIGIIAVDNFSGSEAEGYSGTITLTAEQTQGTGDDNRYLLYWSKMVDNTLVTVAEGSTPTINVSDLESVVVEQQVDDEGNITSYTLTGSIYAEYGASHSVTYNSNYQMGGWISGDDVPEDVELNKVYIQDDLKVSEVAHPTTPTIDETTFSNPGYFFKCWKTSDSGAVTEEADAKTSFAFTNKTVTAETLYAHWVEAATLTVTYYSLDTDTTSYAQEVLTQGNIDDTTFSFIAPKAPEREGYIFLYWEYTDEVGGVTAVEPGLTCSLSVIDEASDEHPNYSRDFYGVWKEALPSGSTISEGTVTLQANTPYELGDGSWTVTYGSTADGCVYAEGSTFYVGIAGDYVFSSN